MPALLHLQINVLGEFKNKAKKPQKPKKQTTQKTPTKPHNYTTQTPEPQAWNKKGTTEWWRKKAKLYGKKQYAPEKASHIKKVKDLLQTSS